MAEAKKEDAARTGSTPRTDPEPHLVDQTGGPDPVKAGDLAEARECLKRFAARGSGLEPSQVFPIQSFVCFELRHSDFQTGRFDLV